jgi:bifunctional DNase/RNase
VENRRERELLLEVRVESLGLERNTNAPVVILQEKGGDRILPIWIGAGEAHAIAIQIADWTIPRPLTHDLMVSVMGALGGTLDRVLIAREETNTYFAELIIHRGEEIISVDARPSDSIAVALRVKAKIFVEENLFKDVSVEVVEDGPISLDMDSGEPTEAEDSTETLKDHLRKLNPEDFGRFAP